MAAILNPLFDAQANAIHSQGGERLKFIGDGLLAIVPFESPAKVSGAAHNAMAAAGEGSEVEASGRRRSACLRTITNGASAEMTLHGRFRGSASFAYGRKLQHNDGLRRRLLA